MDWSTKIGQNLKQLAQSRCIISFGRLWKDESCREESNSNGFKFTQETQYSSWNEST